MKSAFHNKLMHKKKLDWPAFKFEWFERVNGVLGSLGQ